MSGHRPFDELMKHFSPERHKRVAEKYAEFCSVLFLYEPSENKKQRFKVPVSRVRSYRARLIRAADKLSSLSYPPHGSLESRAGYVNASGSVVNHRYNPGLCRLSSTSTLLERKPNPAMVFSSKPK